VQRRKQREKDLIAGKILTRTYGGGPYFAVPGKPMVGITKSALNTGEGGRGVVSSTKYHEEGEKEF